MKTFVLSTGGLVGVEAVNSIPTDGSTVEIVVKIVVQIIIGVATLVGIFKKDKK